MATEKTPPEDSEESNKQLTLIETEQSMPMDKREAFDFYPTPPWCTELLLKYYHPPWGTRIYEPGAGDGAIARILRKYFSVHAIEIQQKFLKVLNKLDVSISIADVLNFEFRIDRCYVGNPPYCMALEFLQRIFRFEPRYVAFLLRLDFLGSKERADFHNTHPLTQLLVLGKRPGFTINGKTDLYNYAWFIWERGAQYKPPKVVMP